MMHVLGGAGRNSTIGNYFFLTIQSHRAKKYCMEKLAGDYLVMGSSLLMLNGMCEINS